MGIFWIALAFLAGAIAPIQGGFNARLGAAAVSPIHASMISMLVASLAIAAYALATRQTFSWTGAVGAPWYAWLGGFCGAFSLTVIILTFPKLGPGLSFGLFVAGMLIGSVVIEHFNILVSEPHPFTLSRLLGVGLVLGGVVLIRYS